jgi:hypothetical protein
VISRQQAAGRRCLASGGRHSELPSSKSSADVSRSAGQTPCRLYLVANCNRQAG